MLTLSIRYIKSDKLRQPNCDEFFDNFVIVSFTAKMLAATDRLELLRAASQGRTKKLFDCSLSYVQPYLI